jgi:hypothetical protein
LQDYSICNNARLISNQFLLPCFDPNKWCMKNGLHSGSLNTRPLSHLYNQIMKLFIQQQVIFSSFAPLNGITFDVIIWLTWWNWIHWKIPKYITLNVLHYLRNIFECDPPASGTRRYKFHPIRSLPPIWKKIKIFHMDEGQLKNVCLSVCRQKERKKERKKSWLLGSYRNLVYHFKPFPWYEN